MCFEWRIGDMGIAPSFGEAYSTAREMKDNVGSKHPIVREARLVGGAVITIAIIALVTNQVITSTALNNTTGPFSGVITSLETTGVAAMSLLVVGLLVVAANAILGRFGGGF